MNTNQSERHTSRAAKARIARRYRAQSALRMLGIAAIGFAALALSTLLYSILSRAVLAVNESYISLDVYLDTGILDPQGARDHDTLYQASYSRVIRNALKSKFPGLGRSEKRKLYALVSDAAAYELRDHVVLHPALVGKSIRFDLLADDDADLFLKGRLASLKALKAAGSVLVSGERDFGGEVTLRLQPGAMEPGLKIVRSELAAQVEGLKQQLFAQRRAVVEMERLLGAKISDQERKTLEARRSQYEALYNDLKEQIARIGQQITQSHVPVALTAELPTLFLKLGGGIIKVTQIRSDELRGRVIIPLQSMKPAAQGAWSLMAIRTPENNRKISDNQIIWLEHLKSEGRISQIFNWRFFQSADASEPEEAGVLGGLMGSFWTMLVTFLLSFPVGVMAALYLEEFAPRNALTRFVEVNINNLAAVPSIVFGLLGLAVFINFFGLPYSSSLVGGMVLALMTLPTVIIASRAAIRAVPPSIREAALGIGASKMQMVFQHVLPLAMPGILTGSIIGMAQALGETAPLLMIGMVAFIVDPPVAVTDSAASLPVLIYLWADRAEAAFDMRTASAILVLLFFLVVMNALAILLRRRFERRW